MPEKKKSAPKGKTVADRFSRGDDSILNTASSAERRFLEGIILVKSGAWIIKTLGGTTTITPSFDLKALSGLPLSVGGVDMPDALKDYLASLGPADLIGPINIARAPGRIANFLNPAQVPPGSEPGTVGIQVSGEVNLDDFVIGVLAAGYLIEKANVDVGAIAAGLGSGVGSLVTEAKDTVKDAV